MVMATAAAAVTMMMSAATTVTTTPGAGATAAADRATAGSATGPSPGARGAGGRHERGGGVDRRIGAVAEAVVPRDRDDGDSGQQQGILGHRLPFRLTEPLTNLS